MAGAKRTAVGGANGGEVAVVTFEFDPAQSPISNVGIGTPPLYNPQTNKVGRYLSRTAFAAVWDTGSTLTCVTPRVVKTANLKPISMTKQKGVDGVVHERPLYPATIWMPTTVSGMAGQGATLHPTNVVMLEKDGQLGDVDVLIGMDIMGRGDTAITLEGGKAWFSFRHPPKGKAIRFEAQHEGNHQAKDRSRHPTRKSRTRRGK